MNWRVEDRLNTFIDLLVKHQKAIWVVGGVMLAIYIILLILEAKSHVKVAPKDEMFVCDKHGAFPKSATINVNTDEMEMEFETGEVTRKEVLYCPRCLEDRITEAKKNYGT